MTPEEFERRCIALYGRKYGWQAKFGKAIERAPRTIRDWLANGIPEIAVHALENLERKKRESRRKRKPLE